MKADEKKITTFKIAAVYIGTVVGAGFASGQEVLQFFGFFGLSGILALLLVTALFAFFGYIILDLGSRLRAESHREIIRYAGGRRLGSMIDVVITFFLFGALTAMAAGAGAIFMEQFELSFLLGSIIMVVTTVFTVLLGIHGVITAISIFVPVLLAAVIGISAATLLTTPIDIHAVSRFAEATQAPVPFWPISAIVYVSYNLVLGVAVLAPMAKFAGNQANLRKGAIYGGIGLGIGALAIHLTILTRVPDVTNYEVPMVFIAAQLSPLLKVGYSLILLAEVYTTAVGSLYGFAARITDQDKPLYKWLVIGTGAAAFAGSQFGFSTLVRVLYPLVGYAGLLMLGGLLYGYARERFLPEPAYKRKK